MDIITEASKIDKTLTQLMKKYKRYYIATAWASLGSKASEELLNNKNCIKKMVVGTHFYQTHPDFIEKFIDSKTVKFILRPNGIYHPKAYLFADSPNSWECLIGSANFTNAALSRNDEMVVHIKSTDVGSSEIYRTVKEAIRGYWVDAESINNTQYHNYKNIWANNKKKLDSLGEIYSQSKSKKPLVNSNIFSLSWDEYYLEIQDDEIHSFEKRLRLLNVARQYFSEHDHFSDMTQVQRREMAGIATPNQSDTDIGWGWFGGMGGAGKFQNRINENNIFISHALDLIPLNGDVYKSDYMGFVALFEQAFPDGGAGVAIASRLLTMKRPDYFVCLDKQNRSKLCEEFGIPQSVSFEGYWDNIIERIKDSVWWSSKKPNDDENEVQAWRGRSAMLDVIFFDEL